MMDLKNKIAIVTGAAHGIGREIALSLARAGADIVVTDISEKVFEVGKQIESLNSKTLVLKCDVSKFEQAENAKKQITDEFENIDILVNNAGVYPQKSFLEMTEDDWNKVMHVNLDGVFHCTKVVLPKMVERKYGKIINISSIAGAVVGFSNLVHYSASKAAVVGFTKSLALEVAQYGINVNAIAPGPVDVGEDMKIDAEVFTQLAKIIPIGRVGRPIDIANLVVFLASNESNFITGQCIVSDGGYTLP
jgi:3-oxoacyl-[acyl-carrier protein] reductase